MGLASVISGGQTGADFGALLAARDCGIETGGWAPKGWLREKQGRIMMPTIERIDIADELDRLAKQMERGVVAPSADDAGVLRRAIREIGRLRGPRMGVARGPADAGAGDRGGRT